MPIVTGGGRANALPKIDFAKQPTSEEVKAMEDELAAAKA
jgi:hypothetical protein